MAAGFNIFMYGFYCLENSYFVISSKIYFHICCPLPFSGILYLKVFNLTSSHPTDDHYPLIYLFRKDVCLKTALSENLMQHQGQFCCQKSLGFFFFFLSSSEPSISCFATWQIKFKEYNENLPTMLLLLSLPRWTCCTEHDAPFTHAFELQRRIT